MNTTPIHNIGDLLPTSSSQFDKYNAKLLSHDVIQNGTIYGFVDNVTGVLNDKLYVTTHKTPVGSPVGDNRLFNKEGFGNQFVGFFGINCVLGNGTTGTAPACLYFNRPGTLGCADASCLANLNHTASTVTNTRYYLNGGSPEGIIRHSAIYSISAGINTFALTYSKESIIELDWVFVDSTNRRFGMVNDISTGDTYACYVNNSSQLIVNAPPSTPTVIVVISRKA